MNPKFKYFLLSWLLVSLGACNIQGETSGAVLTDTESSKSKIINGLIFQVDYLSPSVLAQRQLGNTITDSELNQFVDTYKHSLNFQITITADENYYQGDVMYLGVTDYEAYKERVLDMNFNLSEWIELNYNGKIYKPVLAEMESSYGISNRRKIQLAFASEDFDFERAETGAVDLIYEDQHFNTGINHYPFNISKLIRH